MPKGRPERQDLPDADLKDSTLPDDHHCHAVRDETLPDDHHCYAMRDESCRATQLRSPGSHIIFSSVHLQFRDARGRGLPYTPAEKCAAPS